MEDELKNALRLAGFFIVGAIIGYGQALRHEREFVARVVIGRAICTGGLSMVAGVLTLWIPDAPVLAQMGAAAMLASLGTAGLERVLIRVLEGRLPK